MIQISFFIAVGTPEAEWEKVDLNFVYDVVKDIAENITKDSLVVTKSTVPVAWVLKLKE